MRNASIFTTKMKIKKKYHKQQIVLNCFKIEQMSHLFDPVTKNQVYRRIKEKYEKNPKLTNKKLFSYRTMERFFEKLTEMKDNKQIVKKDGRGKYWLFEIWEKNLEKIAAENIELKKIINDLKKEKNSGKHFIDSLRYCNSDEDWALLEAYFTKMLENKYEKERIEGLEAEQEYLAEGLEQLEKKQNKES